MNGYFLQQNEIISKVVKDEEVIFTIVCQSIRLQFQGFRGYTSRTYDMILFTYEHIVVTS